MVPVNLHQRSKLTLVSMEPHNTHGVREPPNTLSTHNFAFANCTCDFRHSLPTLAVGSSQSTSQDTPHTTQNAFEADLDEVELLERLVRTQGLAEQLDRREARGLLAPVSRRLCSVNRPCIYKVSVQYNYIHYLS